MEDNAKKIEEEMSKHLVPKDNLYKDAKSMLDSIVTSMEFWVKQDSNTGIVFDAIKEIVELAFGKSGVKFKNMLLVFNLQEAKRKDYVVTNLGWLPRNKDPRDYSPALKRKLLAQIADRLEL